MTSADWLEEPTDLDSISEFIARGGSLSAAGRKAAASNSLRLLGAYFSKGSRQFEARSVVGATAPDDVPTALPGIRLRVALAASLRLLELLRDINTRSNFRYELRTVEQVGTVTGQLDLNKWVTQLGQHRDVPRYPVLEATRANVTPENTLVVFASNWIRTELTQALRDPRAANSVDSHHARARLRDIDRVLQLPAYAECRPAANALRTSRAIAALVNRVKRRAARREIRNPGPYVRLCAWVEATLAGRPAVDPGDIEWEFYDESFDTSLFELWCLSELAARLAERLGLSEPILNPAWKGSGLTYSLEYFFSRVDVYYQTSVHLVTGESGHWTREDAKPLGGRPDIIVKVTDANGVEALIVLDPKLRQRGGMPTEEIYKILGYLENFRLTPRRGGILFYSNTNDLTHYRLFGDVGEEVVAVRLNPALPLDGSDGIELIVDLIVTSMDAPNTLPPAGDAFMDFGEEAEAERHAVHLANQMGEWAHTHKVDIDHERGVIAGMLSAQRWNRLDAESQQILATAWAVGTRLPPGADFSGPVLGLCSTVERIIRDVIIEPFLVSEPSQRKKLTLLGNVITALALACDSSGSNVERKPMHDAILKSIEENSQANISAVAELVPRWSEMNKKYRRRAAHKEPLSQADWLGIFHDFTGQALLAETCDALLPE